MFLVAVVLLVDPYSLCEWPVCMQFKKAYFLSPAPNVWSEGC